MNHAFLGKPLLALPFLACGLMTSVAHADLERARSAFTEWAKIKSQFAQEKSEWTREKALLADTLATSKAELEALDKRIDEINNSSTEADSKRAELTTSIDEAKATSEALSSQVSTAEEGMRSIVPMLPPPMQTELQPLLSRLPKEGEKSKLAVSQRLQTLAALLSQVEKFGSGLSLFSEIRTVDGDEAREVKTLYFGLGAAFFADTSGTVAGYGSPGAAGWEWKKADGEIAARISRAIAIHENAAPPAFVSLPVDIH